MMWREKTACFTGHRELRENSGRVFSKVYAVAERLIQEGYLYFGAGGARGFDALAAEAVLKLKEKYPEIHLILVLPFPKQYEHEGTWSKEEVEQHERHKKSASKVVYVQEAYSPGCYYKRDRRLVDFSSACVCYQYKNTGGTAYTTKYAQKKGLKIINTRACGGRKAAPPSCLWGNARQAGSAASDAGQGAVQFLVFFCGSFAASAMISSCFCMSSSITPTYSCGM